ncbi:hypothetical protein FRB99_003926 [Tulasnella sp. 403]|nr:hypothetical protein FRB99_003926 [Tulasnella sp. 403]
MTSSEDLQLGDELIAPEPIPIRLAREVLTVVRARTRSEGCVKPPRQTPHNHKPRGLVYDTLRPSRTPSTFSDVYLPMPAKAYKYCRPPRRPTDHCTHYEKLMNEQDKEMLKIMNDNLDNLLIFAALFSGVNGAFIAITLNLIIPSSVDTTNALLHFLIQRIDNTTSIPSEIYPPPSFPGTTRINCYFCASLAFSLVVALGAIIGKQWLLYYDRVGDVDPLQSMRSWRPLGLEHRSRERVRKLRGLQRWHLKAILEASPPCFNSRCLFSLSA